MTRPLGTTSRDPTREPGHCVGTGKVTRTQDVADGVGFEPTRACALPVFKTGAFNRSATHPGPRPSAGRKRRPRIAATGMSVSIPEGSHRAGGPPVEPDRAQEASRSGCFARHPIGGSSPGTAPWSGRVPAAGVRETAGPVGKRTRRVPRWVPRRTLGQGCARLPRPLGRGSRPVVGRAGKDGVRLAARLRPAADCGFGTLRPGHAQWGR